MKPNDKAIEAAIAEGKRWGKNLIRKENQIPSWKVLRQSDKQYGYDVIAKFNSREERDKALERLRAEAMLTAAYAAQFQSEEYAGLVKWLRDEAESLSEIYPPEAEAADAIETVLAERDALNFELAARKEWPQARAEMLEELAKVRAERDALLARLAPVEDEALVEIAMTEIEKVIASSNDSETVGYGKWEPAAWGAFRAAIAAIRPHIEAAERERCAKIAEGFSSNRDWVPGSLWGNIRNEIAAAIRSGSGSVK